MWGEFWLVFFFLLEIRGPWMEFNDSRVKSKPGCGKEDIFMCRNVCMVTRFLPNHVVLGSVTLSVLLVKCIHLTPRAKQSFVNWFGGQKVEETCFMIYTYVCVHVYACVYALVNLCMCVTLSVCPPHKLLDNMWWCVYVPIPSDWAMKTNRIIIKLSKTQVPGANLSNRR